MKYRRACNIKCMYYVHRCNNEKRVGGKIELLGMYCLWLETTNIFSFFLPKIWDIFFWKPNQKSSRQYSTFRFARGIVKKSSKNVTKIFPKKFWLCFSIFQIFFRRNYLSNIYFLNIFSKWNILVVSAYDDEEAFVSAGRMKKVHLMYYNMEIIIVDAAILKEYPWAFIQPGLFS